jgi:hypothetical protein
MVREMDEKIPRVLKLQGDNISLRTIGRVEGKMLP